MRNIRIAAIILILIAAAGVRGFAQDPQDMAALSQEFMQLWQDANSARMAGEYDKSITIFEKCLDPKFETSFIPGIHAYVNMSLGMLYVSYLNLNEEGRIYLEKAVAQFEKDITPDIPYMATANAGYENAIASSYTMLGDHEKAVAHFLKAIEYNEAYYSTMMQGQMDELTYINMSAANYFYVGREYKKLERADKAAEYFNMALERYTKLLAGEHNASVEMLLSYIYYELGELDKCIDYFIQFLDKRAAEPFTAGDATALLMLDISRIALAHYHYEAGQWDEALAEIDTMINAAEKLNWTSDMWRAYHLMGRVYEKQGKQDDALAAYEKAIAVIESQRSGLGASDDRASFMELHIEVYNDIIRLLIEMGRDSDALQYLERSKARSFLDMIGGRKLGLKSDDEKQLVDEQIEVEKEINRLTMSIRGGGGGTRGVTVEQNSEQLRSAQNRLSELLLQVKNMNPEFSSLVTVNPPDITQVQALLGDKAALIEYFPGEGGLNIWVMRNDSVTLRNGDATDKKIGAQVQMLRSKITRGSLDDGYARQAENLYDMLIAPVEDIIADADTLVIVPHGPLHYLPFNLLMKDGEFLIDRFVLAQSPSGSALVYIVDKENPDNRKLFALGDPETTLDPLPAARAEVEAIETGFPGAVAFFGGDAMETLLGGNDAAAADFVHIASHGLFYPDKPMFSALALSADDAAGRDGFLQVHEIFGLNLKEANLVTLSACETGLSAITGGDDLVGLSRAFIYAGAPRIIVSLWSVNDVSTGELMKNMYGALQSGEAPAVALRNAQLALKSNPEFSHPFFWAPFQIIGDWR